MVVQIQTPLLKFLLGWTKSGSNYKRTMDSQVYAVSPEGYIYKNNDFITSDKYKYLPSQVLDVAKDRKAGYYAEGGLITHPVAIAGEAGKEALFNMPQLNSLFDMLRNPFKYHVPNVNTPAFAGASGKKKNIINFIKLIELTMSRNKMGIRKNSL